MQNKDKPNITTESVKPTEETQEQINWRKFRQEREKERREREEDRKKKEEAERKAAEKEAEALALKMAMEAILNKSNSQQSNSFEEEETEDQRIERKVNKKLEERDRIAEAQRREQESKELPQKLVQAYSDFESICTTDNLDYLEYHYPEVVAGYKHMPDSFEKWSAIYKSVKRFIPNTNHQKEQARIEKNLSKPQSMSLPGVSQTGDHAPTELTEKRRQDNWARMQRVLKGIK